MHSKILTLYFPLLQFSGYLAIYIFSFFFTLNLNEKKTYSQLLMVQLYISVLSNIDNLILLLLLLLLLFALQPFSDLCRFHSVT
jgi:hypothetical protein